MTSAIQQQMTYWYAILRKLCKMIATQDTEKNKEMSYTQRNALPIKPTLVHLDVSHGLAMRQIKIPEKTSHQQLFFSEQSPCNLMKARCDDA